MGWAIANACSNNEEQAKLEIYVNENNEQGKSEVSKFIKYVKDQGNMISIVWKQRNDNIIEIKHSRKGQKKALFSGDHLEENQFESIYNSLN